MLKFRMWLEAEQQGTFDWDAPMKTRTEMDVIKEKQKVEQEMGFLRAMSGARGYVGIEPESQEKYRELTKQWETLTKELWELGKPARDAEEKRQQERNDAMWEKKAKKVAEATVKERKNGWEIVYDGLNYHLRDPHTKESAYEGKLGRVRQVATEGPPEERPDVESHDAAYRELQKLYRTPEFRQGDREVHQRVRALEGAVEFHKPAAIARAEREIEADKSKRAEWDKPKQPTEYKKQYKSAPDLAADYKQRGLSRQLAWDQYVKDTILQPLYRTDPVDAKEFYRHYDQS